MRAEQAPGPLSEAELGSLTAPTYLMMGEHEVTFNPRAAIERARATLPNLKMVEIVPGVGHGMISENPEEVNRRIMTFLADQPLASG